MMRSRMTAGFSSALAVILVVAVAVTGIAAPSGPPIRIGSTLALTGPLAATALLHKITGATACSVAPWSGCCSTISPSPR
jgi:branched-chain amino acid transport system substrate-binding protein